MLYRIFFKIIFFLIFNIIDVFLQINKYFFFCKKSKTKKVKDKIEYLFYIDIKIRRLELILMRNKFQNQNTSSICTYIHTIHTSRHSSKLNDTFEIKDRYMYITKLTSSDNLL